MEDHKKTEPLEKLRSEFERIHLMCRIITQAPEEFVTMVTINNNRQNPVKPWNLRANDLIQLRIQDKFREELGIYYERQEEAFENLSDEELEEQGITEKRAIELTRLARTFLVSEGEIDKLMHFGEVFEDEEIYDQVFNESRVKADARNIVLCYKVQFRLGRLANDIIVKGVNKYAYVQRTRNLLWALLCQAILNDSKLEDRAEEFGRSLSLESPFIDWLSGLATTRCRFLLSDLVGDRTYAAKVAEGNFSFLQRKSAFRHCMQFARERWQWQERRLK